MAPCRCRNIYKPTKQLCSRPMVKTSQIMLNYVKLKRSWCHKGSPANKALCHFATPRDWKVAASSSVFLGASCWLGFCIWSFLSFLHSIPPPWVVRGPIRVTARFVACLLCGIECNDLRSQLRLAVGIGNSLPEPSQ